MKRTIGITGAVAALAVTALAMAALALAMSVPTLAADKASLEALHAKAARANTAVKHASVARDYRLQAETFGAKAAAHEKEAAQLTRASGVVIHKWPAMASGRLQDEKAKALEARRAERESMVLADRHIRLAVEAQAERTVVAGE